MYAKAARFVCICLVLMWASICVAGETPRTVSDFNFSWRFTLGDEQAWAQPEFDDRGWRTLHLPHDWSIEGEFSPEHPAGVWGGALPGGIGWYRKHFATPAGKCTLLEFDGVYMNSTVYVNGHEVGNRPNGYSSFCYDVTQWLRRDGGDNVVAVRVDNSQQPNSRWYSGSGIYRNVRLVTTGEVHVAYNGVCITTPTVQANEATLAVKTEVTSPKGDKYGVRHRVMDADGAEVASAYKDGTIILHHPHRWDIEAPYLYTLVTEVVVKGQVTDRVATRFGIRTAAWDADRGFLLNGRQVKLLGVCLHHDMSCLGTAVHRRALERQLTIMRNMGVNAIRTSHNPPAPELLDLCDEMGLLVMDEALDTWRHHKAKHDYATYFDEWHERDLTDFVKRDRNHPSVILWSIGNEIYEQSGKTDEEQEANRRLSRHLSELVKRMDDTRAVTSGNHSLSRTNNIMTSGGLDVLGLNYRDFGYDSLRVWFPGMPIVASETVSAQNSRGVYFQPSTKMRVMPHGGEVLDEEKTFQCTAYDMCHAMWETTCTHQDGWIAVRDHPFVAGTFVWTGFDYLGEPTAYGWPARSSYFGIVDLAGFPKDVYYIYQSEWTDKTVLHLLPHWNWNASDSIDVWAYYNHADEVELLLNGRSLGRSSKTRDRLHAFWEKVPFEPGELTAISYQDGQEVARTSRTTTGAPAALRLTADRTIIAADGYDLSFVTVEALDAQGCPVPTADQMITFKVKGAGELLGVDNGNAAETLCLRGDMMPLFNGKVLAVVRSLCDQPGTITLIADSPVGKASCTIISTR